MEGLRMDEPNPRPRHYSIPLAMVVLAGLIHANFEDWLFAVGSYISVYFWVFAFLLADLVPDAVWFRPPLLFPEVHVRRQPVSASPCPPDDPIVYQWPGRERGGRPHVSSQCDTSFCTARRRGDDRPAACGNAPGAWELPNISLVEAPEAYSAPRRFFWEQTMLPKMIGAVARRF